METRNCSACGKVYFALAGHSCGDTGGCEILRETLAKEMTKRFSLENKINLAMKVINTARGIGFLVSGNVASCDPGDASALVNAIESFEKEVKE